MLVINDTHIGVVRSGGTTPQSQQALRDYLRTSLINLIGTEDSEVTCNGDMLDSFTIDTTELVKVYDILADWLGVSQRRNLNLCQGNHDSNPRGDKISSFHLLSHFLQARFPGQVTVFDDGFASISDTVWCIPHRPNQALFDLEIEKAAAFDGAGKYLLLHCNYKNGHAEGSDHSLNLNDDQVGNLMRAGWTLVLGHEHVGCEYRSGRVIVVGNQNPSSISDCIGDPFKQALLIGTNWHRYVKTWDHLNAYIEVDWRDLSSLDSHDFVRVTGEATAIEAAEVIKAISSLRQRSDAFVIANGVRVDGQNMITDMASESIEDVKAFDVLSAIYQELTPEECEAVKGLLNAD